MGKILLILLGLVVLLFAAFSFALGMLRRFLGLGPRRQKQPASHTHNQPPAAGPVLYHDSRTEVLQGESTVSKHQQYSNIRDVSFTESKTDSSSRR